MNHRAIIISLVGALFSNLAPAQNISWSSTGGSERWEFTIESETQRARLMDFASGQRVVVDLKNARTLCEYVRSLLVRIDDDSLNLVVRDSPVFTVTYLNGDDLVTRTFQPLQLLPPAVMSGDGVSVEQMTKIDDETRRGADRLLLTNLSTELRKAFQRLQVSTEGDG